MLLHYLLLNKIVIEQEAGQTWHKAYLSGATYRTSLLANFRLG
jgi:hypothetical protein